MKKLKKKILQKISFALMIIFIIVNIVNVISCSDATSPKSFSYQAPDGPSGLVGLDGKIIEDAGYYETTTNYYEEVIPVIKTNNGVNITYLNRYLTNMVTNTITNVITRYIYTNAMVESDLYRVYVPFAEVKYNYTNVSYKDTNGLHNLWKDMITKQPFFIRNSRNTLHRVDFKKNGDYYYFDKDLNVRHRIYDKYILKKYEGAIIVKYMTGSEKGLHSVGGLYRTGIDPNGYKGYNTIFSGEGEVNSAIKRFMAPGGNTRDTSMLEVLVMNVGWSFDYHREFGVDCYLNTKENNSWGFGNGLIFRNSPEAFIGERIEYYWNHLNVTVNLKFHNHYTFIPGNRELDD